EGGPIEEIMQKYVGRFREKKADWAAFEDAKIEGFKRAQHRFIGAGGSGKHGDPTVIPAKNFTLSIMYVEPGQGNAAHTHEVEECFFVLEGYLDVFVEDESGKRITTRLGPWECISCPAGVLHGYQNDSLEPVYFQVLLARILQQHLQAKFATPFVVENKSGAGGSIGTGFVAKAQPDGYTLLVGTVSSIAINSFLYTKLNFDVARDIQPVSLLVRFPNLLFVHPKVLAKSLPELTV